MSLIAYLLCLIVLLLFVPVLVLFVQVVLAFFSVTKVPYNSVDEIRIAILIPAHNEESGIAKTMESLLPEVKPGDQILVVADNCSDSTASIVRQFPPAEVIERENAIDRGKGFALDFGVKHLSACPPDVLVIVDADCLVDKGSIRKLAERSHLEGRPVQALYLMQSPMGAGIKTLISEFAWLLKNLVRPLGYSSLNLPCQLMGSGMAFPWELICQAKLANGNIVEDLQLGLDLCRLGKPSLFFPDAKVTSLFPSTEEALTGQRTRWEHGHLGVILNEAPSMIVQSILKRNKDLFALAVDLLVPPLALLLLLLSVLTLVCGVASMFGLSSFSLSLVLVEDILLILAVFLAWYGWGRSIIPIKTFLLIPFYIIAKIPSYFKFVFKRQKTWVRTERD